MTQICWLMVDVLSRTLAPDERDAVRGDIAESNESAAHALRDLAGLVARRQAALWKDWRPWAASLGLVAPVLSGTVGFGWIGLQLRTLWTYGVRYQVGLPPIDDIVRLICLPVLSIVWAWSGGFALGFLSRQTAWVIPMLGILGALLGGRFPQVVLILIPFLWGVRRGVRGSAFHIGRAAWLAVAVAVLTLVMQVEDGRSGLAFAAWRNGGTMDGRLAWTPRLLPFAAIVWQFGFIFATTRFKENKT